MERGVRTSNRTWLLMGLLFGAVGLMAVTGAKRALWEILVAAAFTAAALVYLIWRRGDVRLSTVLLAALAFRLALISLPPVLSDDAYRYVWDGLLQTQGINPYLYPPDSDALARYHTEPVYEQLNSRAYYSVYPPISQLIFWIGGQFYDYGWQFSYYVIKAIFAAFEFAAVLLLARMVGAASLLLYAWNPLVLIAGAGQAHGESVLVFFLVLALWAWRRDREIVATIALVGAGMVKLYPFVLLPFLWRRVGWRSVAVSLAVAVGLAAPYVRLEVPGNVLDSLDLYVRFFEFNAGFYYVVKEIFELFTGADWSKQIGPAFRLTFLAALPALYVLDWRKQWRLRRSFALAVGLFLVLSTTVHPWYLIGILVLVAPASRPAWHWYWLSVVSIGTYLLYVDGAYWVWVVLGWSGWMAFAIARYRREWLDSLMRFRARGKAGLIAPMLSRNDRILDLGAAEGFVAEHLADRLGLEAELADVADMNRTSLPHRVYDGRTLPFETNSFDVVVIVYVLHHADSASAVLKEAVRVARRRVIILESTYRKRWERRLLIKIDQFLNWLRSQGTMEEGPLDFRTYREWIDHFRELGFRIAARRDLGGFIHHRALFVLDASDRSRGDIKAR